MSNFFGKNFMTLVLIAIIILMGVEIIYLVGQNRKLKSMLEDPLQYFKTLKKGEVVPSLRGQDIYGNNVSFRYSPDEPHTFLFWFSPTCSSCEDNKEFWHRLYTDYSPAGIRFLGMCGCDPEEARLTADEAGFPFTIMSATDKFIVDAYKGNIVPQTVHIAPDGRILGVWPGALTGAQKEEIINTLNGLKALTMEGGEAR